MNTSGNRPSISIVIACRNEEEHLPRLFQSLEDQDYAPGLLEILFVDDHSDDDSLNLITKWKNLHQELQISILQLDEGNGKKQALRKGILESVSDYILCTDADCYMGRSWVQTMVNFVDAANADMVLGPVTLEVDSSFIQQFQLIELSGLQAVTEWTANHNKAVMGNGANILFNRKKYLQFAEKLSLTHYKSGDDVFLIHAFKKEFGGKSICFAVDPKAMVTSYPESTFGKLFWQHVRWASKSKGYSDLDTILLGITTAFINILCVLFTVLACFQWEFIYPMIAMFIWKGAIEFFITRSIYRLSKQKFRMLPYLISVLIYPFFVSIVLIASLSGRYYWKGRWVK